MRRLLAVAAGALALLVLPTAPAHAAFSQAAWTSPDGVTAPAAGSDDWTAEVDERSTPQQVTLAGVFDHPDGVARVSLVLERAEYPENQPPCGPTGFGQQAPGAPSGPTTFSFEVLVPCNGTYVVRAMAESRGAVTAATETAVIRLVLTVAAPAVPVQGLRAEATSGDDPQVALTWEPVPEPDRDPDFAGYDVERAVDRGAYEVIGSLPDPAAASFVDKQPAESGGTHRYRVVSLRRAGAGGDAVVAGSEAAPEAEAELPRSDDPDDDADADGDGGGDDDAAAGSSGRRGGSSVSRSASAPSVTRSRTATTVDTGFGETLPFDQSGQPGEQALPQGDGSVVAQFDDDGEDTRKQTLALVAGGSAMAVGALGVRRLLRKAASPYEILS